MITYQDIRKDIEKYDQKIMKLKCELMDLKPSSKGQRRKYHKKREQLQKRILHISGLRQMALDALAGKFENALAKES